MGQLLPTRTRHYCRRLGAARQGFALVHRVCLTIFRPSVRLAILLALRGGVDPTRIPEGLAVSIGAFWEKIGGLVRAGHIDQELLWNGSGGDCAVWWRTLAPLTRRLRAEVEGPTYLENFEWLAGIMNERNRRAGLLPTDQPSGDETSINRSEERTELAEDRPRGHDVGAATPGNTDVEVDEPRPGFVRVGAQCVLSVFGAASFAGATSLPSSGLAGLDPVVTGR